MKIIYHKKFEKRFKKLSPDLREKVISAIQCFSKNHALTGNLSGKRAFSVTSNVRIIFEEYNNYILVMVLDVGSHNQVYN